MKLVFLQNSATQPRCHKRFRTFKQAGVDGVVYSFNRNWYNVNLPKDIKINSLGELLPGSYFKRLLLYIRKLRPIFNTHTDSIYYCYGQDMAFVTALFGKKYIYEESDIMYLEYKNPIVRSIMKWLDLRLQKRSLATVLTSQGFVDYLYKQKPDNVFVLPNKLDSSFAELQRPQPKDYENGVLRFAFIGLIRYERTISAFVDEMAKFNPNYEFHIWGDGGDEKKRFVKELCDKYGQVIYHGPFRNPIDLPEIYSNVDVNFVCYDTNGLNERIAEPNKLYESTFFNTPIMVSPNTYLSKVVEKWNTGFVVNCLDRKEIVSFLDMLSVDYLEKKSRNCSNIESEFIVDNVASVQQMINYIKRNQ